MEADLKIKKVLEKILRFKKEYPDRRDFEWCDVGVQPATLTKLVFDDVLKVTMKSSKHTYYDLAIPVEEVQQIIENGSLPPAQIPQNPVSVEGLFDIIVGYDDIKEVFRRSLTSAKPVHILLVGSPATGKSLFLMDVERLGAEFMLGGSSTKVGIRDVIYERLPRILIVDEIDKVNDGKELAALLSWMESGRVVITKHGLMDERKGLGWVFAACNTLNGISQELRSRFHYEFNLKEYSESDFITVCKKILIVKEGTKEELAQYIAYNIVKRTRDVRKAIGVARIAKDIPDAERLIKIQFARRE